MLFLFKLFGVNSNSPGRGLSDGIWVRCGLFQSLSKVSGHSSVDVFIQPQSINLVEFFSGFFDFFRTEPQFHAADH